MLPRKIRRGKAALKRLRTFEGMPTPYSNIRRLVCPDALKVRRMKPGRKVRI